MSGRPQWKAVIDKYGISLKMYEVSRYGEVRSYMGPGRAGALTRPRLLAGHFDRHGRHEMNILDSSGSKRKYFVHRLVAYTWIGLPPGEDFDVFHRDRDPGNNYLSNLCWMSKKDMAAHFYRGQHRWANQGGAPKLTQRQVDAIRESDLSRPELSRKFGISERHVTEIRADHERHRYKPKS